jgi:glycosyltransferase involved in cell wall biosynthesis
VPTVSVAIPTYNQPGYLIDALESVFAQTFADFEVVVVDDGSTDDTPARLREYAQRRAGVIAGRLRVVRQENAGIGAARNRAVAEGRGRYVALLDHDDLWMPDKLQTQVRFMQAHPECSIVVVPWAYSKNPGRVGFDAKLICDAEGVIHEPVGAIVASGGFILSSAMMFDRQRSEGIAFETERNCLEDIPFHLKLLARGPAGVAGNTILMVYRSHDANASSNSINYYRGVPMMRAMNRAGLFGGKTARERRDIRAYLAHTARTGTLLQLLAGRRLRALRMYAREFCHQARLGRLRYLLITPLLMVCPQRILHRKWGASVR